jgi:hypothetical protein
MRETSADGPMDSVPHGSRAQTARALDRVPRALRTSERLVRTGELGRCPRVSTLVVGRPDAGRSEPAKNERGAAGSSSVKPWPGPPTRTSDRQWTPRSSQAVRLSVDWVIGGRHWTRTSDLLHVKHFRLNAVLGAWDARANSTQLYGHGVLTVRGGVVGAAAGHSSPPVGTPKRRRAAPARCRRCKGRSLPRLTPALDGGCNRAAAAQTTDTRD